MDIKIAKEIAHQIKDILAKEGKSAIRLEVVDFGWGGPVFDVVLDEQRNLDEVVEIEGIKFVAESSIKPFIRNIEITIADGRPAIVQTGCCC